MGTVSISDRMGLGPTRGFDYLRIMLATAVLGWHSFQLSYGNDFARSVFASPLRPLPAIILPMFFALSGFLVTGSLVRQPKLYQFAALRVLRIVPALAVEILLSALILGPLLTTLPLESYFTHPEFRHYFLNVGGWIHYTLPGVFSDNPAPQTVNGQLWTIPFELECYVAIVAFSLITRVAAERLRRWLLVGSIALAVCTLTVLAGAWQINPGRPFPGRALVIAFLLGVAAHMFRERVLFSRAWAVVAGLSAIALLEIPACAYVATVPIAYLTIYLGLLNPPKAPILMDGDYSYGVYLFAFPIQQLVAHFSPLRHWWVSISIALPLSLLYASASWHLIEKPVLQRKAWVLARLDELLAKRTRRGKAEDVRSAA